MTVSVLHGECLVTLRGMPAASFDGMLSDPPAGIAFMGAEWDGDKGGRDAWIAWLAEIFREALRVLKPGARGLVWALPRTSHWTGMALELAGFDVVDRVTHVFGTGYAKSLNMERAVSCETCPLPGRHFPGRLPKKTKRREGDHTCPITPEGKRFLGCGTALKPACEDWWSVMKPIEGTYAENALRHGTGMLAIDATRLRGPVTGQTCKFWPEPCEGHASSGRLGLTYHNDHDTREGEASAERSYEETGGTDFAPKPGPRGGSKKGRFPPHLWLSHSPGCLEVGTQKVKANGSVSGLETSPKTKGVLGKFAARSPFSAHGDEDGTEMVESWDCAPGCPVAEMDRQSGDRPGMSGGIDSADTARGDSGGSSRFFYVQKPTPAERDLGCEDFPVVAVDGAPLPNQDNGTEEGRTSARNDHPTLKSVELATRLGATILPTPHEDGSPRRLIVPFAGSGTEPIGAARAGWEEVVGIEADEHFVAIARARVKRWAEVPIHLDERRVSAIAEKAHPAQRGLFG